jgi:hypothetical protein
MKSMLCLTVPAVLLVVALAACAGTGSYETAPYKVLRSEGAYEVRAYPGLKVAATLRKGDDDSFMRLFRYIEGANEKKEKVAMTTPVFMEGGEMRFVVPEKSRTDTPRPSSDKVQVRELPARTMASYRFSGWRSDELEKKSLEELRSWMAANKLVAAGEPLFAYYNPPWTPGPFRRNEVLVPVK